jgi:CubicO group peptidase (beta-lactamase class C family)
VIDAKRRTFVKQSATAALALGFGIPRARGAPVQSFLEAARSFELHSLMVARHGKVLASAWFAPYRPAAPHLLYSLSKSFTSTAVGFAVAEGKLRLSDKVVGFFPRQAPATINANLAALKVEHLLTMSVGQANDATPVVTHTQDWVAAFLQQPIEFEPGSVFLYNSAATYMLSAIVQKVTGQTVNDYLSPRLFAPLGIPQMHWATCPLGINTGGWGLSATTETLMKFGQFYLQRGRWKGRQLLPAQWIEAATSFHIQQPGEDLEALKRNSDWHQGYGYQFWRCRHNAFRGDGAFGQFCIVLPEQDAVIAITSRTLDIQGLLNLVWEHLLPNLDHLAPPAAGLSLPLPRGGSPSAPPRGKTAYSIEPNDLGVLQLIVSWDLHTLRMKFETAERSYHIIAGIGSWHDGETEIPGIPPEWTELVNVDSSPRRPAKLAAAGAWKDSHTFEMQWRYYETPHYDTVALRFSGSDAEVSFLNSLTQMAPTLHAEKRPVLKGTSKA